MSSQRVIPSIDLLLQRPVLARAAGRHGRARVGAIAAAAARTLRAVLADPSASPLTADAAAQWLEARVLEELDRSMTPSLEPVVNATGVIVHTNLGRAPLARAALDRLVRTGGGYTNLEYDVAAGTRGHRHVHAERLLRDLTGAEAALVVNNNAAATLVVLAGLAAGREVLVSRGELVEIGGGFRVPEVMAQSGASLREVGTTNRTRVADYAAAIGDRTGLILRVHPSNFRMEGFTERPALDDLAALARRFGLPLFEDLGSGWLGVDPIPDALRAEPSVRASVAAGVDLVAFSGDKLLGGPQAGIVVGRRESIDRVRTHPLVRAVRADKLAYAALEATLALWAREPARAEIPVYRMLTLTAEDVDRRARSLVARLESTAGVTCRLVDGSSTIGGGSAPGSALPTRLVAITVAGMPAGALDARLRAGRPPVISRIVDDVVVLDLRTVAEEEDDALAQAVGHAASR